MRGVRKLSLAVSVVLVASVRNPRLPEDS